MAQVVFKSKQSFLAIAHENLFHCGAIDVPYKYEVSPLEPDLDRMREMGIKAPQMYDKSYLFKDGKDHNLLTLSTDEEIEAMRLYIKKRKDDLIVEITTDNSNS